MRLTEAEVRLHAAAGCERRIAALFGRSNSRYGVSGREPSGRVGWATDIESAGAELYVAAALTRYWTGVRRGRVDVGRNLNVRHTPRPDGCLILHPEDEGPFILVTGCSPEFRIVGGIKAEEGKRAEFWRASVPWPAWFVPQSELRPVRL